MNIVRLRYTGRAGRTGDGTTDPTYVLRCVAASRSRTFASHLLGRRSALSGDPALPRRCCCELGLLYLQADSAFAGEISEVSYRYHLPRLEDEDKEPSQRKEEPLLWRQDKGENQSQLRCLARPRMDAL